MQLQEPDTFMPLILSLQHIDSPVPSDFQFTVLKAFDSAETLFQKYAPQIIAAGTFEGPIIFFGCINNDIIPICLLSVHSTQIPDLLIIPSIHALISISFDCTLRGWSLLDATALFSYHFPHNLIDYQLCVSQRNPTSVWVYSIGYGAYLYNLVNGNLITFLDISGLFAITVMITQTNPLLNNFFIVCMTFDNLFVYDTDTYDLPQPNPKIIPLYTLTQHYFLSEHGLLEFHHSQFF
jgi:hypothetical protein